MLRLPYWQDWPLVVRERKTAVPVPRAKTAFDLLAKFQTQLVGPVSPDGGERRFGIIATSLIVVWPDFLPANVLAACCRNSPDELMAEADFAAPAPAEPFLTIVYFKRVPQDPCVFG